MNDYVFLDLNSQNRIVMENNNMKKTNFANLITFRHYKAHFYVLSVTKCVF